jgi:hypothetical protein
MRKIPTLVLTLFLISSVSQGQTSKKDEGFKNITESVISGPLEFLSSDWTQGRETGTKGAYMASDYVASMFKTFGLEPGGDLPPRTRSRRTPGSDQSDRSKTYFQNFNLLEYRSGDNQSVSIISKSSGSRNELILNQNSDFTVTAGTRAVNIESDVVFVGYGFKGEGYNDYDNIDVRNKVILRLTGFPGHLDPDSKAYQKYAGDGAYSAFYIERGKDDTAIAAGAVAVIELSSRNQTFTARPENYPFRYNEANWEGTEPLRTQPRNRLTDPGIIQGGLTKVNLSPEALAVLMDGVNLNIEAFENEAEIKLKSGSRTLDGKTVKIQTSVESRIIQARNVIGILEGKQKDTCIVLGAHYDHLGQIRNYIYNGSDDNASGTVGIMTIAKAMVESGIKPEYTIVFCAWTAEEKGLIGSAYFANNPVIKNIKCYMNYDMISRIALDDPEKNKCDFQYTSTVPLLKELTEKHIKNYNVNLDILYKGSETPTGGSDFSSFSRKGIPIFLLHGKFTPDYHQYTDHSDKADLTYMRDIIRVGFLNIFELSTTIW